MWQPKILMQFKSYNIEPKFWKYFAGALVGGLAVYKLRKYFGGSVCNCSTNLNGRVVIITGASSGIGKALAIELAKRGAQIVLACRDMKKGLAAKSQVIKESKNTFAKVSVLHLDLCKINSIFEFTERCYSEFKEIYALVNNAGVFYHPHGLTEDGFEITLQTNYFGHFILTEHLLKLLRKSDHARIINVSSEAHRTVTVEHLVSLTQTQSEVKLRDHFVTYGVSKLALILFTKELARKLSNTKIIVTAVNPGNVETDIFRTYPPLSNLWLYALQWPIRRLVVKTPQQGAQTVLHAILTPDITTGRYYTECRVDVPCAIAYNDRLVRDYYKLTLRTLAKWFDPDHKGKSESKKCNST